MADPDRKARCEASFRDFCETYFTEVFYLPWSDDHLRVIDKIEKAVRTGGLFAMAVVVWASSVAMLIGHHKTLVSILTGIGRAILPDPSPRRETAGGAAVVAP